MWLFDALAYCSGLIVAVFLGSNLVEMVLTKLGLTEEQ